MELKSYISLLLLHIMSVHHLIGFFIGQEKFTTKNALPLKEHKLLNKNFSHLKLFCPNFLYYSLTKINYVVF